MLLDEELDDNPSVAEQMIWLIVDTNTLDGSGYAHVIARATSEQQATTIVDALNASV